MSQVLRNVKVQGVEQEGTLQTSYTGALPLSCPAITVASPDFRSHLHSGDITSSYQCWLFISITFDNLLSHFPETYKLTLAAVQHISSHI